MVVWLWSLVASGAPQVQVTNVGWGFVAVYAVHTADAIVLVEAQNPGKEDRILRRMRRAGLDPDAVTAVVLTHGHPDHAGSAAALRDALGVPTIAGRADMPYLAAGEAPFHATGGLGKVVSWFVHDHFPGFVPDIIVDEELALDSYGVPATVRVVGGHTPGSLVVEVGDQVLVGDLIRGGIVRRNQPKRHFFHDDEPAANEAIGLVLARGARLVVPTHGGILRAEDVGAWLDAQP